MYKAIAGLSLAELEEVFSALPRFRAKQIYEWIIKGAESFDQMTNLPAFLQKELSQRFLIFSGDLASCHKNNNTKKIVLSLNDGVKIESVLLYDAKKRTTACISTQAGCPAGCIFCKTASLGFIRNLDSAEIVEQFFHLRKLNNNINDKNTDKHIINNIVIMGMGEPLLNLDNLRKAITVFNCKKGLNFSLRRITVSTCGICSSLFDIANNGPYVRLALSLPAADKTLREYLMPIAKNNPLEKIKEALLLFQQNGGGRITLEVPMLAVKDGGINTDEKNAFSIAAFAEDLNTVVNIIPWNPVTALEFKGKPLCEPDKKEISLFVSALERCGLKVTKRLHKGRSVSGACGQLGSLH